MEKQLEGNMPGIVEVKIHRAFFLLSLLSANKNEPVVGRTKLEKLLFLIGTEILGDKKKYSKDYYFFEAYKFGPFSTGVLDDIELMKDFGFVDVQEGRDEVVYKITQTGLDKYTEIFTNFPEPIKREISGINKHIGDLKSEMNVLPLTKLISYVYQRYPAYTIKSEISHYVH